MAFDTTQSAYVDFRSIVRERSDAVVAWVGAGLSKSANLPGWIDLRDLLVRELRALAEGEIDHNTKMEKRRLADHASVENDFWNAFGLLRDNLGEETYRACIRRALADAERVAIPPLYKRLWKIGISGMLSLNLDRLANRAFNEIFPGRLLNDFTGNRAGDNVHVLRSAAPWLANLHGIVSETTTWVFTAGDLRRLLSQPGYAALINACLTTRTIVFLGITADDVAAGGHLARLTESGVDCGGHYWITDRGSHVRDWAEKSGIRVIQYSAPSGNHAELNALFDDLEAFSPTDTIATPVRPSLPCDGPTAIPAPEIIENRPATEIRQLLNARACEILEHTNDATVAEFERFSTSYAEAIYRAWYVSLAEPKNEVLGYKLLEKRAEGAFGTVYRATDAAGNQFALKVLHERIREDREMLQSFRRGVRSMRILTDSGIPGIVKFHNASEIPAMVVMDFIEGIDLSEAVKRGVLREWVDLLRVATNLTQIIRKSHRLPQRVLHRDIRPSNAILENCWGPHPRWDEVRLWVLDFDLSYHLDAFDVSVSQPGTSNGFLAPEQVDRRPTASTRSAAVDSFGLGMTMYYLRTGIEPRFAQHRYRDWLETLDTCARNFPCASWVSLPKRFSRLIEEATRDAQDERLDVARIEDELLRLGEAERKPADVRSVELLTEELAARSFSRRYQWNREKLSATYFAGSVQVAVIGSESKGEVSCEFQWLQGADEHHQDVRRWLPRALEAASSALRAKGWTVDASINTGQLRGLARLRARELAGKMADHAKAIENATSALFIH